MKKLFLGVIAAGMLMSACNQSNKSATTQSAAYTAGTAANSPAAPASTATSAANAPVMKFEFITHDFGKIKQGESVTYKFKFANIGKSPLIISNATASCGCTTPEWPKGPIKPLEGGIIKVTFNSAGKTGLQDKLITITANTVPAQNMVHLIGEVQQK